MRMKVKKMKGRERGEKKGRGSKLYEGNGRARQEEEQIKNFEFFFFTFLIRGWIYNKGILGFFFYNYYIFT